ncbi:MAG: amidohydrolase family protein [Pirellulales bacterium]
MHHPPTSAASRRVNPLTRSIVFLLLALLALPCLTVDLAAQNPAAPPQASPATPAATAQSTTNPPGDKTDRWEADIEKFEQLDAAQPPRGDGVVFVGSSSIVRWKLDQSFPGEGFVNRGFGGSKLADVVRYVDRIVPPHRPRVVVVYAGDNDLAGGRTPTQVIADYKELVRRIHERAPATRIIYLSIKASLKRWALAEKIRGANAAIARYAARDSRLAYVDLFDCMLGADGRPRAELLDKDELHLSPLGYELWTKQLQPVLTAARDATPDLIVHNGQIATIDKRYSFAQAFAVRGDRITRIGSNDEILALRGERTQVLDLQGRFAMPGMIDSHVHAGDAAMHEFDHPVPDMESIAEVLDYVKSRVAAVPEGQWITVNQVFITRLREQRFPTRAELDAIAPKHPVVFSTGPDGMANSLALKLSGIDRDFVVQGSGAIEKDPATGELTGMLRGGTKRYLKIQSPPSKATEKDREEQFLKLQRDYHAVGLTGIADRNASRGGIERYHKLHKEGRLTLRVAASHSLSGGDNLEKSRAALAEIANHPLREGDLRLRIVGVKTFLDGGMLTGSAFMRQPWGVSSIYGISDPEYRGVRFIPEEQLLGLVRATVEQGLQFTAHSVGDGAVHGLLDAYAEVNKTLPIRATRPCITHCNFMSREAVEKMAELGVVADIQPAWLYLDSRTLTAQFGYDRLRYFQPLRTIFELGAIAGGGSDHMQKIGSLRSINPYDPFLALWTTQTRRGKWFDGQLHPEEALNREQALRFYTINNAYVMFLEDQVGSLEPGKLADFIVLDRNLATCSVDDLRAAKTLRTFVGGVEVYTAP